ncbi:ImmA/IrrE family metallo-endopeptidase [Bullifex sp.]|uniref:ImmA/IrrE family metallo-endopeptidase n=1 Tax=Bullifex sp. TaxID=2815808 RepID=UPI002A82C297|nr:ImmA/IrrE family metallo-endopeptidase [Bullifex sp.]MDY4067111.1 ImmA/IrrE family metallo-endopeptidase [Bullifex sp.]
MIDYADLMTKAERLMKQLGEDNNSPVDIFALAQGIELLTIVYYPLGNKISGMCVKGAEGRCTIALNSSMTLGRQRFTLAHVFFHMFYDTNMKTICAKSIGTGCEIEKMADAFAAYFLMPRAALADKADNLISKHEGKINLQDIIRIEQYFGVSHQTAVYQLNNCGYISRKELDDLLNISVKRQAEAMGFSSDLYLPLPKEKQYCTYGHYIKQADQLLNRDIISNGKYEELMLAAFRDDLVYGAEEGGELID